MSCSYNNAPEFLRILVFFQQISINSQNKKNSSKKKPNLLNVFSVCSTLRYPVLRQNDKSLYGTIHVGIHKVKIRNAFNQKQNSYPLSNQDFTIAKDCFFYLDENILFQYEATTAIIVFSM